MERNKDSDFGSSIHTRAGGFFDKLGLGFGERFARVFESTNGGISNNSLRGRLSQFTVENESTNTFIPLSRMAVLPKGEQSMSGFKHLEFTGIHQNWVTEVNFLIENNLIGERLLQKRVPVLFSETETHAYIKDNLLSCFHELASRRSSIVVKDKMSLDIFRNIVTANASTAPYIQQRIIAEIRGMIPKRFDTISRESHSILADIEEYKRQHPNVSLFSGKIDGKSTYFFVEEVSKEFQKISLQDKINLPKIRNIYLRIGDLPIYQGTLKTQPIQ